MDATNTDQPESGTPEHIVQLWRQNFLKRLADHAKGNLEADGVLLVALNRDPLIPGRIWFEFEQTGIEVVEMIGIINKLMADVNKHFIDAQLDPPFPQAKEFIRHIPPTEGQ